MKIDKTISAIAAEYVFFSSTSRMFIKLKNTLDYKASLNKLQMFEIIYIVFFCHPKAIILLINSSYVWILRNLYVNNLLVKEKTIKSIRMYFN